MAWIAEDGGIYDVDVLREEIGNKWRDKVYRTPPHFLKSSEVGNKYSCFRKRKVKRQKGSQEDGREQVEDEVKDKFELKEGCWVRLHFAKEL